MSKRQAPEPQQWWAVAKFAGVLVDSVSTASGVGLPIAGPAVDLLKAMSRAEDAETATRGSIERQAALIRGGPFRAALEHLATALRYGPEHPDYGGHLKRARDRLCEALSQSASVQQKSLIRYYLGLVEMLRGNKTEAEYQWREAIETA